MINYFTLEEFQCRCGKCPSREPDQVLWDALNQLRSYVGKPITIVSGIRCSEHNAKVGGDKDSSHVLGEAVDIYCPNSMDRYLKLRYAIPLFKRVGIGKTFLHLDVALDRAQEVIWLYA